MPEKISKRELDYIRDIKAGALTTSDDHGGDFLTVLLVLITILLVWAYFFSIDEVTSGQGKVVPFSKVKRISNLEGGLIKSINVKEGDTVKVGQILITLDGTQFISERGEKLAKYNALIARAARLRAEINNLPTISWPQEVSGLTDLKDREMTLFKSRRDAVNSKVRFLAERILLLENESNMLAPLVQKGIMSQIDFNHLKQNLLDLQGQRKDAIDNYFASANQELNDVQSELNGTKEKLVSINDKIHRTSITAPVSGIVKSVHVSTKGGVIQPGENIMEIVPEDESLLIEAKITPQNIGFISPDQPVNIKVTAYDYAIYGGLKGTIVNIGADTVTEQNGNSYYIVNVRTDKNYLEKNGKKMYIIPGMTVDVNIVTGHRSIMMFVLKPIIKTFGKAMHER